LQKGEPSLTKTYTFSLNITINRTCVVKNVSAEWPSRERYTVTSSTRVRLYLTGALDNPERASISAALV